MFKENKEFWLYIVGIILMFFLIIFGMRAYFADLVIFPGLSVGNSSSNNNSNNNSGNGGNNGSTSNPSAFDKNNDYYAVIKTNKGELKVELFEKNAPNTVNSFIYLSTKDYYDNSKFHRLVKDVALQGGSRNTLDTDLENDKFGNAGYIFDDEINWDSLDFDQQLRDQLVREGYTSTTQLASKDIDKYRLAMANAGPNLNGGQFFIVLGDQNVDAVKDLRGRHTVFAEIIENKELIDSLNQLEVDDPENDSPRPVEDIVIEDILIYIRGQ